MARDNRVDVYAFVSAPYVGICVDSLATATFLSVPAVILDQWIICCVNKARHLTAVFLLQPNYSHIAESFRSVWATSARNGHTLHCVATSGFELIPAVADAVPHGSAFIYACE